jgi:hypothetical protein
MGARAYRYRRDNINRLNDTSGSDLDQTHTSTAESAMSTGLQKQASRRVFRGLESGSSVPGTACIWWRVSGQGAVSEELSF